jgi:hypothetical protein
MRYTVTWVRTAEHELARIWNQATDRQAVADASDEIDDLLARAPMSAGSPAGVVRKLMVWPLFLGPDP